MGFLTVSAVLRNPNFDQGITFTIVDANLKEGDINLSDSTKQYVAFGDAISNCQLISDGITGSGIFTITKFDKHKRIVSGIFHFQLDKVGCQSIQATEGRFNLTLTL